MSNEYKDCDLHEPFQTQFLDTDDIVQAQTKARIDKYEAQLHETYLQQQARLKRQRREAVWFGVVIVFAVLLVLAGQIYKEVGR